ncbi:DUF5829 family protein [Amycolatopsis sp. H20-H5]|uniref:DUF5829 family protein n=1 Tax=Amycolatopsis sp. H20-H5 TaxID=3046309 RepID=UPI002DB7D02F|nr:DUF5829 family protein [Amycolatopsis sp. H20-H5]MEC3978202.1 DUF5829 family protein [Amycolatopsis sp. H20-H5]
MVLTDAAALAEIAGSGFVDGRFARLKEKKADSSVAGSYRTLGIAGENTLIELFGGELAGGGLSGGLVFSFEEPGSSKAAHDLLDESGVGHHHDLVRRSVPGADEQQPWYHLISVGLGDASPFVLLLNEVTQEYFTSLGAVPEADGTLPRRAYLDAVLGGPAEQPRLLEDITSVTLHTSPDRARHIADALTPFGYEEREAGDVLEVAGLGFTLRLRRGTADDVERVAELGLALNPAAPPPETREFRFGTSELVFDTATTARWIFS